MPTESETDKYNLNDIDPSILNNISLYYIGKGSEQIVYKSPKHPDLVIKIATTPIRRITKWNQQHNLPSDSISEKWKSSLTTEMLEDQKKHQELTTYFGKDHVLNQKKCLRQIPTTDKLLEAILEHDIKEGNAAAPKETTATWSIVTIQQNAKELLDSSRISLNTRYAEDIRNKNITEKVYAEATKALLSSSTEQPLFNKQDFLTLYPQLSQILEQADTNNQFKTTLTDFVTRAINYSNHTGSILDIVGPDNLIFSQQEGYWNYRLIDALYPGYNTSNYIEDAKKTITQISHGEQIKEQEKNRLRKTINYARAINGLSAYLKLSPEQKINILPTELNDKNINLQPILQLT